MIIYFVVISNNMCIYICKIQYIHIIIISYIYNSIIIL